MERVTTVFFAFSMNFAIQSLPIENGFSVKFNPIAPKEDLTQKQYGVSFAKIPQDFTNKDEQRRDVLTKAYFPQNLDVPTGYSNQVAKFNYDNIIRPWNNINFFNLPIIPQPYEDYKILIATAPSNMHLDDDNKRTIIYVVFPDEKQNKEPINNNNIPVIYFVNEKNNKLDSKKGQVDPILVVDSNRTVTGLKSKEVAKFVKFKNKWTNRYDYQVTK